MADQPAHHQYHQHDAYDSAQWQQADASADAGQQQQQQQQQGYYDEYGQWYADDGAAAAAYGDYAYDAQYDEAATAAYGDASAEYGQAPYAAEQYSQQYSQQYTEQYAEQHQYGAEQHQYGAAQQAAPYQRPQPPTAAAPPPQQQQQQQQLQDKKKSNSRIDPRQIPRPVSQRKEAPTYYYTNSATNPPDADADYIVVDEGNASPRYLRMTSYQIPVSEDLVDSTRLSVGAIIQPLANPGEGEEAIPVVDMGKDGPIRCGRCHAYLNPFFTFSDDGQRFVCNLCNMSSPVPHDYFCNVDADGVRRDRDQRAELRCGSVEFIAPPEYCTRPAQEPCYVFVVDVSHTAIMSGVLDTTIRSIRSSLEAMADYPRIRVGIITYHSAVHVYSFKNASKQAVMMIVGDVDDVFVPVPVDEILVHPHDADSRAALNRLLDSLMELHGGNRETESAFGAAVHVGVEAMSDCGGKLLVVQTALPRKGMGALDDRDDSNVYGTDKERSLYLPQDSFYQVEATTCAEKFISVDLFVCANSYVDLATVNVLSMMTGGQIYYYPNFKVAKDGYALECDIMQTLTRETGFEGVMAIRTSAGLKVSEYFGSFFRRNPNEVEVPVIDCDKSIAVRLEHEDRLDEKKNVCIQCALLYTNFDGERRIRVHTVSVPSSSSMATLFRHADLSSVVNLSLKQAAAHALDAGITSARKSLRQAVIDILYIYRKKCASASSSGQLILPESLKLLPVYTLGMMKSVMLADGSNPDDRVFFLHTSKIMSPSVTIPFCLPRLYSIHDMPDDACLFNDDNHMHLPQLHIVASEFLEPNGIYLLDNGLTIFVWIGPQVAPDVLESLVGYPSLDHIDADELQIYASDDASALATRVSNLVEYVRAGRPTYNCLRIVHPRSNSVGEFDKLLVEDSTAPPPSSSTPATACEFMSYVDFLCHIHRAIQDKMLV